MEHSWILITMANIINRLETEFHILAVDYNGQYAESEKPFTSRRGEAEDIIRNVEEIQKYGLHGDCRCCLIWCG